MNQCKKCLTMKHIKGDVCERCETTPAKELKSWWHKLQDKGISEHRRIELNYLIKGLLEKQKQEIENLIIKEIRIAQQENTKTSRLTSLLNNIMDL